MTQIHHFIQFGGDWACFMMGELDALPTTKNSLAFCTFLPLIMRKVLKSYNTREVAEFLLYTLLIYIFYLISGLYHEKLLTQPYPLPPQPQRFQQPAVFSLFPQLTAALISYLLGCRMRCKGEEWVAVPWSKALVCGLVVNFNMWTNNQAVVLASFPAVIMVKSCGLLSVILVGVFCSRVKDKSLKLTTDKLAIGAVVTAGILIFNYFQVAGSESDRPFSWTSAALLLGSLVGDGFLPDLQAEIKAVYRPGTVSLYYHLNRATFLIAFALLMVSGRIVYVWDFMSSCPSFAIDMLVFSLLNAMGQLAVYRMVTLFKQHIPAFVIATRKCFTVVLNILIFNHRIAWMQTLGIALVFTAVLMEVFLNYRQKSTEQHSLQTEKDQQASQMVEDKLPEGRHDTPT